MNDAFFSAVEDVSDHSKLSIRARVKGDLEKFFGSNVPVIETEDSDYRFRVFVKKEFFAHMMKKRIEDIEYTNFKDSIPKNDSNRYYYYTKVWSVMLSWQEKYFGCHYGNWYETYRNNKHK